MKLSFTSSGSHGTEGFKVGDNGAIPIVEGIRINDFCEAMDAGTYLHCPEIGSQ
ncbi:hypothetical protein SK128_016159 [Halocaridina rubra]|uniref:Uncharacterized protein n=1 Tax=Halocaridina rubra TaxID=373956 RepID=A0AAN8ZRE7_HALRR